MTSEPATGETGVSVRRMSLILMWPLALDMAPAALAAPEGDPAEEGRRLTAEILRARGWTDADPLTHAVRAEPDDGPPQVVAYQEYVYFHRYVQRFLYGRGPEAPMWVLRRDDIKAVEVAFGEPRAFTVTLAVDRLRVHLFDAGAAVLVAEVSAGKETRVRPAAGEPRALAFDDVLVIQNRFRRAYPPYWIGDEAKEFPQKVRWLARAGDENAFVEGVAISEEDARNWAVQAPAGGLNAPVATWWSGLLPGMNIEGAPAVEDAPHWRHVVDERMPSMLWLSVDDPRAILKGDWWRLAFADDPGANPAPYAKDFLEREPSVFYDRFWEPNRNGPADQTTRYSFAGYHFAVVGGGGDDGAAGFFENILRNHFRHHYAQMGLICHFHYAALLASSNAISLAVRDNGGPGRAAESGLRDAIADIRRRHLKFTHSYWFTGVSNQMQGGEMFERWRRSLGTDMLYPEVSAELASATGFLDDRAQEHQAEAAQRLNVIVAALGMLALAVTIIGIALGSSGADEDASPWRVFALIFGVVGATAVLGGALFRHARRRTAAQLGDALGDPVPWLGFVLLASGVVMYALSHLG